MGKMKEIYIRRNDQTICRLKKNVLLGTEKCTNQSYAVGKFTIAHLLFDFSERMIWIIDRIHVQTKTHRSNYIHSIPNEEE